MTDNEIKTLMKKSLLHVPEKDFTEKVMERIYAETVDKPQSSRDIKLSWFFMMVSVVILPFGLKFLFWLLSLYDPYLIQYFHPFSSSIVIRLGFIILFTTILLIQLDNLIRTGFHKRKWFFQF